jgi:adhesin transport system outer membrane protein
MARYHVNPIPPGDLQENSIPTPALMGPPAPPVGGAPPEGQPTGPNGR